MQLKVQHLTQDSTAQAVCHAYWRTTDGGNSFAFKIAYIAQQYNISEPKVTQIATTQSRAYRADYVCVFCRQQYSYAFNGRSDPMLKKQGLGYHRACSKPECQDALRRDKTAKMESAYRQKAHHKLDSFKLNFLIHLAQLNDFGQATNTIGVSQTRGRELLQKFHRMHPVNWGDGVSGWEWLPEMQKELHRTPLCSRVKSVFGSVKAQELYRRLQCKYPGFTIFPEMPIAAFVDMRNVEHLFVEKWHRHYFLTARMDFVVCDNGGVPQFGVEYNCGYHQGNKQQVKDAFKTLLLNTAGLSVLEINKDNIREI